MSMKPSKYQAGVEQFINSDFHNVTWQNQYKKFDYEWNKEGSLTKAMFYYDPIEGYQCIAQQYIGVTPEIVEFNFGHAPRVIIEIFNFLMKYMNLNFKAKKVSNCVEIYCTVTKNLKYTVPFGKWHAVVKHTNNY